MLRDLRNLFVCADAGNAAVASIKVLVGVMSVDMGSSSYMIAEGSVWPVKWIQESILIEVLRVMLL